MGGIPGSKSDNGSNPMRDAVKNRSFNPGEYVKDVGQSWKDVGSKSEWGKVGNELMGEVKSGIDGWKDPVETIKNDVKATIEKAKEFREKLRGEKKGKGASERSQNLTNDGKTAKQVAEEAWADYKERNKLDPNDPQYVSNGRMPKSLTVIIAEDGTPYIGINGELTKGGGPYKIDPDARTITKFGESSKEGGRPGIQCSEASAYDRAIKDNQNPDHFDYHTIGEDNNGNLVDKHTCDNCDVNLQDENNNGRIHSNNKESLVRKERTDAEYKNRNKPKTNPNEKNFIAPYYYKKEEH